MRKRVLYLVVATTFHLTLCLNAKATVYSWTSVYYEPEVGSVRAFVETLADYDTSLYYCSEAYGYVYQNGVEIGDLYAYDEGGGGYTACVGRAMAITYFPYDPNAEYDIESFHEVDVIFNQTYLEYYDYYDYVEYTYGDQVIFPNNYAFVGLGPPHVSTVRDILLGTLNGVFVSGGAAGQPHHVKVLSDTGPFDFCGAKARDIRFQVVDSSNRRVGTTKTKEKFYDAQWGTPMASVYNSCRSNPINPSPCTTDIGGIFTDSLGVGCPEVSGDCGTSQFLAEWLWCPGRGRPDVRLTTNTYYLRRNTITVNGQLDIPDGTHLN